MPTDHSFSGVSHRRLRVPFITSAVVLAALASAPAALAWNGNLQIRKVNAGGPATDSFTFKVEARAYGRQAWSVLSAAEYSGPASPFYLHGAASASGPFSGSGASPTEALLGGIESGGENAAPAPAIRDWRGIRVTETAKPAGYRTTVVCEVENAASAASWTTGLGMTWGPFTSTPTSEGGGAGVVTALRYLPDTVASQDRGPWTTRCTFTNTYRARVRLIKRFDDPVSPAPRVDMTLGGADVDPVGGGTTFGNGDATDWIAVDGGSDVAIAEQGTPGTSLTDYTSTLECRVGAAGAYGDWSVVPGGTAGTLTGVQPGKDYECRFSNVRKPAAVVAAPPPGSGVLATPPIASPKPSKTPARRRPSARAVGTSGCVRGARAIADVRGRQIARVTFRVNRRVVKVLRRANVAGMFRLSFTSRRLRRGTNRVTAYVRFRPATRAKARLLVLSWSRCARRTPRPRFTG